MFHAVLEPVRHRDSITKPCAPARHPSADLGVRDRRLDVTVLELARLAVFVMLDRRKPFGSRQARAFVRAVFLPTVIRCELLGAVRADIDRSCDALVVIGEFVLVDFNAVVAKDRGVVRSLERLGAERALLDHFRFRSFRFVLMWRNYIS